jgi:plasmid stabilization system protein ParE
MSHYRLSRRAVTDLDGIWDYLAIARNQKQDRTVLATPIARFKPMRASPRTCTRQPLIFNIQRADAIGDVLFTAAICLQSAQEGTDVQNQNAEIPRTIEPSTASQSVMP